MKQQLEYAHKVSKLEVGKWYLVAHAEMVYCVDGNVWDCAAILPYFHKDGFAPEIPNHYHLDNRFRQPQCVQSHFRIQNAKSNYPVVELELDNWLKIGSIVYKRKKCIGLDTGLKTDMVDKDHDFFKWYNSMKGKSCKGRKCPHFGATMSEINGELICPMHGLKGDILTEIII